MTKFVRNSRLRRVVSTMCSVALLASLVVMPAYAVVPGSVTSSTLAANLSGAEGVNNDGIRGTLTLETTGTPALQASQESTATYQSAAAQAATMASLGVTNTAGEFGLRVAIYSGSGSFPTTDIAVPGISLTTTITGVVEAINAAISGIDSELRGTAFLTPSGRIRVLKGKAAQDAEIWVHSGAALIPGAFVDQPDPAGLTLAEAVFGGNNPWGRGSGPADSYRVGTSNLGYSAIATWSPQAQFPFMLNIPVPGGAFTFGSFDNGVVDYDNFVSAPDTMTGLFTAVISDDGAGSYALAYTAGRATPILSGVSTLVYGSGVKEPAYEDDCSGPDAPTVTPSVTPTAGAVATWTVSIDDPDTYWNGHGWSPREQAYNGISVLFPKEFELVSAPDHAAFINALVASVGSTPTVNTTVTPEGTLVTISNFVDDYNVDQFTGDDGINFQVALKAPVTAGAVGVGAKIWTHSVGTPWTASPMVTQLIDPAYPDSDGDDIPDTDWFPLYCYCGPEPMTVTADVLNRVELSASRNRAGGYTALTAKAYDVNNNEITDVANVTFGAPTVTGTTDGAAIAARPGYKGEWIWNFADTAGDNTVTLAIDDDRTTTSPDFSAKTLTLSTAGITEPAKVVVIPDATTWVDGSNPSYQIELQDADGDPTCWLDEHNKSTQKYTTKAYSHNVDNLTDTKDRWIWRGWSRSTNKSGEAVTLIGTNPNAWPMPIVFSSSVDGPDAWTITAKSNDGLVLPAVFAAIDVTAEDPEIAGVPVGFKLTAVKAAPAEFADGDQVYNDKVNLRNMDIDDNAFGYAAAGGVETVKFEARVVDAYGNVITNGTANIPVRFEIPVYPGFKGTFATGHVFETTTDANGVATVEMKSFEPQLNTRMITGTPTPFNGDYSWFTPVVASTSFYNQGSGWASCGSTESFSGYGFAYFHGAEMVEYGLTQTPEGYDHDVVLADGVDTSGLTVKFLDSAFNTPIANWDVKFTTSFGTFADGSKAVTLTTDANGMASAPVKSTAAGLAFVRAFDRWLNSTADSITFTDFQTKFTVNEPTKRAGDRATAKVTAWAENIKTGQRVQFDDVHHIDFYDDEVFGYDAANTHGLGVNAPVWTNEVDLGDIVDTDDNGKYDAVELFVPAFDESDIVLESAGKRYALIGGQFTTASWFNNVFYDQMTFAAAPARPEVDFVKEAMLTAEGTQLDEGLNLVGSGFTPAHVSDMVDIYLGDITTHGRTNENWVGYAYVGADGSLMPTAVFNGVGQIAPGEYDITVDGLVFKKGLVVKNLFNQAAIKFRGLTARNGDQLYISGEKDNVVQVDAYGALNTEVWMGGVKLANSTTTGNFIIPKGKFSPGKYTVTAKVMWPTMSVSQVPFYGGYTTVVKRDVYVQGPLKFGTPSLSASGRTLKVSGSVSGAAEWNGSKAFKVKVQIQQRVNGRWVNKGYKYVNANASTGKFSASIGVSAAGTYRAVVSHKDNAHPASSKGSGSRSVR